MNLFWLIYFLTAGFFIAVFLEGLRDPSSRKVTRDILNDSTSIIFLVPIINTILLVSILYRMYNTKRNKHGQ